VNASLLLGDFQLDICRRLASGFIFTMTKPQEVRISKVAINELLGYKPRNTWQQNRLLDDEASKLLISRLNDLMTASATPVSGR